MGTHSPTATEVTESCEEVPLTSAQIGEALAKEGLTVSPIQLSRWSGVGLLGEHKARGRGRGLGKGWFWEPDTLPRARIIARALEEKGATFDDAALRLLLSNYVIAPQMLRRALLELLHKVERDIGRRRPFLRDALPVDEKLRRMVRSFRNVFALLPREMYSLLAILSVYLASDSQDPPSIAWFHNAVESATDAALAECALDARSELNYVQKTFRPVWEYLSDYTEIRAWLGEQPPIVAAYILLQLVIDHHFPSFWARAKDILEDQHPDNPQWPNFGSIRLGVLLHMLGSVQELGTQNIQQPKHRVPDAGSRRTVGKQY